MNEDEMASMEAAEIDSQDNYFAAREEKDTLAHRKFFEDGFVRGYKIALEAEKVNYE